MKIRLLLFLTTLLINKTISQDNMNIKLTSTRVTEDITVYMTAIPTRKYTCNFTVIKNGNEALVIDAGYEEESAVIMTELLKEGLSPTILILSHTHEDHIKGYENFGDVVSYAGEYYRADMDTSYENIKNFEATHTLKDGDELKFGNHHLRFWKTPGHGESCITIIIDENIYHVGDLIFGTLDKPISIPYLSGNVMDYIRSLKRIKTAEPEILLLGHGEPFFGIEKSSDAIEEIIYYMEKLAEGKTELSDCLKRSPEDYGYTKLHEHNVKNISK